MRFNGPVYDPYFDHDRLKKQLGRVWSKMIPGGWHTLGEIAGATGDPEASVSAQLRHLRKPRFGSYVVEKRNRGARDTGLFEYRLMRPGPELKFDEKGQGNFLADVEN